MATRLYPVTSNAIIEKLASVPAGTTTRLASLEREISKRTDDHGCYHPLPDELEVTNIITSKDGHVAYLLMPDGWICECDTGLQGEGLYNDYSFAVHRWMRKAHPDEDRLSVFLLFGWGKAKGVTSAHGRTRDRIEMARILNHNSIHIIDDPFCLGGPKFDRELCNWEADVYEYGDSEIVHISKSLFDQIEALFWS